MRCRNVEMSIFGIPRRVAKFRVLKIEGTTRRCRLRNRAIDALPLRRVAVVNIGLLLLRVVRVKIEICKDNGYLKMAPCDSRQRWVWTPICQVPYLSMVTHTLTHKMEICCCNRRNRSTFSISPRPLFYHVFYAIFDTENRMYFLTENCMVASDRHIVLVGTRTHTPPGSISSRLRL